jgi:hypothetical protein
MAVERLAAYDVFDRSDTDEWELNILPFQYGMKMRNMDPKHDATVWFWRELLGEHGEEMCKPIRGEGVTALVFERENYRITAKAAAYDCMFEGMLCLAINARGNSLVLEAAKRPEHKMLILWGFTGGRWRVSLYENGHADVDCGEIAKKNGGGGHKGAAGFEFEGGAAAVTPVLYFWPVEKDDGGPRGPLGTKNPYGNGE